METRYVNITSLMIIEHFTRYLVLYQKTADGQYTLVRFLFGEYQSYYQQTKQF